MSTLTYREKRSLENLLGMSNGYVLSFGDRTFGDLFDEIAGVEIHSEKYQSKGTSKAKKLRAFWEIESDSLVGEVLSVLIHEYQDSPRPNDPQLIAECQEIAQRLLAGGPSFELLTQAAAQFNAAYINRQTARMEDALRKDDPDLAIGTAKELIETCCKTILEQRNVNLLNRADMPDLIKATLKELNLARESVPSDIKGSGVIKRMLSNIGSIANDVDTLRNLYGTGHGPTSSSPRLSSRHAKLVVGVATALTVFLFESHSEK